MTTSSPEEIRERTLRLLHRISPSPVQITDSSTLVGDLGLESIQALELVAAVERTFGITVDDGACEPIQTVADLLAAIERRIEVKG